MSAQMLLWAVIWAIGMEIDPCYFDLCLSMLEHTFDQKQIDLLVCRASTSSMKKLKMDVILIKVGVARKSFMCSLRVIK